MYYLGVDIEEVGRFSKIFNCRSELIKKLFFVSEWEYSISKSNAQTLCGIWCAKESVVKAFSTIKSLDIRSVHISHMSNGTPFVSEILGFDFHKSFKILISISHSKNYAIASCLVYETKTT